MKGKLLTLSLAALTIGLLGSCSKMNERIDNLEKRVDGIEATSIASVQQQIDGIKTSINDLKAADAAINGKIDDLKTTAEAQQTLIDALKEADKALGQKDEELEGRIATLESQVATINGQIETLVNADKAINTRIDELKSYVDTQIGNTKDWAEETFATLDQYQQTADDLAALSVTVTGISTTLAGVQTSISGLDTKIDGINTDLQGKITAAKTELEGKINDIKTELEDKIADAISTSEASIKSWINKQLEAYYTIAQVEEKIGALNTAIEAAKDTSKYRIDSLATELTTLKKAVDAAKDTIKTEYEAAIAKAISDYDGEICGPLKDSILAVNGRAEALDTRVTTLEGKVLNLEGNVDKLLAMIQSVSITPAYSDGSVEAEGGILTLKCIVRPAEVLTVMQSLKDSLLIYADSVKVKTKATPAYMEIKVKEASVLDNVQGAITLKADISEYLPKGADKALTIALNIKNGISDFTTEFVPVTVSEKPIETIADVLATVDGGFPKDKSGGSYPTNPSNSWANGSGSYVFVYPATNGNDFLIFKNPGASGYIHVLATTLVTPGENCYTATTQSANDTNTLTFQMTAGKLTSINFSSTNNGSQEKYGGTYTPSPVLPDGALPGVFSVSAAKTVHFSKGNLTYDVNESTNKWKFYEHQYDCATGYDANLISLFTWGYNAEKSIAPNGSASDNVSRTSGNLEQTEDWGCTIGDGNTWRTLTTAEWQYLFNTRSKASSLYKYGVTVCGKTNCVVLLPDNWTWNASAVGEQWQTAYPETADDSHPVTWQKMHDAGAVCLPAAGVRNGSDVNLVGDYGSYWSSSAYDVYYACSVYFASDLVYPDSNDYRDYGCSVRLITECQ